MPIWYSSSGLKPSPPSIRISWDGNVTISYTKSSSYSTYGVYYQESTGDWEFSTRASGGGFTSSSFDFINCRKEKLTDHRYDEKGNYIRDYEITENSEVSGGSSKSSGSSSGSSASTYSPTFPSSSASSSSPVKETHSCSRCSGSGRIMCSTCTGAGTVRKRSSAPQYSGNTVEDMYYNAACSSCGGTGKVTCTTCGGTGRN